MIAAAILFSGLALVPFIELPNERLNWQRFADAYKPAEIEINHRTGSPGSIFTITGFNYPPDTSANVIVNGQLLGTTPVDNNSELLFLIDTVGAELGNYFVTVSSGGESDPVDFLLSSDAPLRAKEEDGPTFNLPADIAMTILHLPLVSL